MPAAPSPTSQSAPPQALTPTLEVVQRWVNSLGMSTRPVTGNAPDGSQIAGLEIHRGPIILVAFSPPTPEPVIILKIFSNFPASLRASLGRLGDESRRQLTDGLFAALQSNPRSGYQVLPVGSTDVSKVTQISLEQVMRVMDGDSESFNRLLDGIQELVSGFMRVGREIGTYVSGPAVEATSRPRSDSVGSMFQ
jgi:hypothetical protein